MMAGRERGTGTQILLGFGSSGSSTSTLNSTADDSDSLLFYKSEAKMQKVVDLEIQARMEAAVSYVASSVFMFK